MCSIIYTTTADTDQAERLAEQLLDRRLIACANVFEINSVYRWKGDIMKDDEVGVLLKTKGENVDSVISAVEELHPYEVPCALALDIQSGSEDYLEWIRDETD